MVGVWLAGVIWEGEIAGLGVGDRQLVQKGTWLEQWRGRTGGKGQAGYREGDQVTEQR